MEKHYMESLFEVFKDNNEVILKEGSKYSQGTRSILGLTEIADSTILDTQTKINILRCMRDAIVIRCSDMIEKETSSAEQIRNNNIYLNMVQYITTEIDYIINLKGGRV